MEQVKSKKKGIIISGISAIVLIAVLGVTFAIWNYSRTTDNQILVTGDVYMKFKENPALTIENAIPSEGPGDNDYFEFTIEGVNKYSKPIWYEIDIQHGDPHESRQTRIEDNLLAFKLVEVKEENQEEVLIEKGSYTGLAAGKGIYVNTIPAGTNSKITRTYRIYMWISSKTIIGNTSDANYDMEAWNDVYASIKVNVKGDFNEKELYPKAIDAVKDTLGQSGGVIGLKSDNTSTTNKDDEVREYRYSGLEVNNYIYFNCEDDATEEDASSKCELWRIVGVFKDESGAEHLKIVSDNVLTREMFPAEYTIEGTTYKIQYREPGDYAHWNYKVSGTKNNDWATAGLQYWLNTTEDETAEEPNKGYLSYLKGDTLSMIEDTKYYLGTLTIKKVGLSGYGVIETPKEAYANERDVESCEGNTGTTTYENFPNIGCNVWANNQATWKGKVALLYPSDYGFSASTDYWDSGMYYAGSFIDASKTSWLKTTANHSADECLLSPSSNFSYYVTIWLNNGTMSSYDVDSSGSPYGVRPSLNLKSNIKIIGGDGSKLKPYFLSY